MKIYVCNVISYVLLLHKGNWCCVISAKLYDNGCYYGLYFGSNISLNLAQDKKWVHLEMIGIGKITWNNIILLIDAEQGKIFVKPVPAVYIKAVGKFSLI